MLNKEAIDKVKKETNICNTFCCYEECKQCVEKYLNHLNNRVNNLEE